MERLLFVEALILLYFSKLMLLIFPFRICIMTISAKPFTQMTDRTTVMLVKRAITWANKFAFWKNRCLVQSFAARWMLQHRDIHSSLMIGIARDENKKLKAHAWLMADNLEIVPQEGRYMILKTL